MTIDFHSYTLKIFNGKESSLQGMFLVQAGNLQSHRHRKGENLALLVDVHNGTEEYLTILPETLTMAGKTFFNTPGSVTNAIQQMAAIINQSLLKFNLEREDGETALAALNVVVHHKGSLFIAQAGGTHTLLISKDSYTHFSSEEVQERGLGVSRRFFLNYKQAALLSGDLILLSTSLPDSWGQDYLQGSSALSMQEVRRRLFNQLNQDISAVVVKCREGRGIAQIESWGEVIPSNEMLEKKEPPSPEEKPEPSEVEIKAEEYPESVSEMDPFEQVPQTTSIEDEEQDTQIDEMDSIFPADAVRSGETERAVPEPVRREKAPVQQAPRSRRKKKTIGIDLLKGITSFLSKIQTSFQKIGGRIAPNADPMRGKFSTQVLNVIVVAIPLILIAVAALVYVYSGRREQHKTFLDEAQTYISQAADLEQTDQQRDYWTKAYESVLNALDYGDSDLADSLLVQTQTILDDMDLVTRLDFRPATTSQFAQDVSITKIKSNDSGIYLLDENSGSIFRAEKSSKGFYDVDGRFQCSPGTYGVVTVGKIIDFAMLPTNTRGYQLLAMDAGGNLLYCQPDEDPVEGSIIPPEEEWGRIGAFSLDEYTLYVADVETDRIYSISGRDFEINAMAGIVFSSHPRDYLGTEEIDLGGLVDIIVNKEDIFIMHSDSHMTTCQYNAYRQGNPTECLDPAPYGDSRIGYEKNPLVYFNTEFSVIQETFYPNAAFYILDSASSAVMQFSSQLNLERLLKPQPSKTYPLPDQAMTGLGVTTDKEIFLAYGNQLYVGEMP